jgi:hypothetical protein
VSRDRSSPVGSVCLASAIRWRSRYNLPDVSFRHLPALAIVIADLWSGPIGMRSKASLPLSPALCTSLRGFSTFLRASLVFSVGLALGCPQSLANEEPVTPATSGPTELRKPAPNAGARPYRERFQSLIRERYPQLLTETVHGMPVVTVLFDLYGDIVRSDLTISSQPPGELAASEANFYRLGLPQGELLYVGAASVQTPTNTVLIVFGGKSSRDLDRALVQRFFPQVLAEGAPLKEGIWILFDQEGRVLRSGQEPFEPDRLREVLEQRYPGIQTSDMTTTPVVGRDG